MRFRMLIAALALGLGTTSASAQVPPPPPVNPLPLPRVVQPPTGAQPVYHVMFRQPYWRQQTFRSEAQLANFIALQERNGWDIQVLSSRPGHYTVRYRLMQWGGSANFPDLPSAQQWAAQLENLGYEPQVVLLRQ
jgi:hypothetical protein